jgi:hypothetical protein
VNVRQSLSTLFTGITTGYAEVTVTPPGAGLGARIIPFAIYRSSSPISAVPAQNKQP